MNTLIASRINLLSERFKEASPDGHATFLQWTASQACEYALSSLLDDRGTEAQIAHRNGLSHILAWTVDEGLQEHELTKPEGIIEQIVEKTLSRDFRAKSYNEEEIEFFKACGDSTEEMEMELNAENLSNERKHIQRITRLKEATSHYTHILTTWVHESTNTEPVLDSVRATTLNIILTKYGYQLENRTKFCHRGARGVGMNSLPEEVRKMLVAERKSEYAQLRMLQREKFEAQVYELLEQQEREGTYDNSNDIDRGRAGDNENADITY